MSRNTLPAKSAGRQPRALVRLNGAIIYGWISWTVSNNSYFEADTFRVSFAESSLSPGQGAAFMSRQSELFIEVFAGFPADPVNPHLEELAPLIYGRVDSMDYDPANRVINLSGRDLTAAFIDTKIADEWASKTASEIATLLAQSHGLTPVVTATSTPAGTRYKAEQMRLSAERSEWDLLAYLAREEAFVCYVTGSELHFEPEAHDESNPYVIRVGTDGSINSRSLKLSRSMTVAKGITVTARSPSLTKKTPVVESYPSAPKGIQAGRASPFGSSQAYYFTMPSGKTPTQAQQFAERMYRAIVDHAVKLEAMMPADNVMDVGMPLLLEGTGTAFDQVYFVREVTREMSLDEGYVMTVQAQNSTPDLGDA